MHEAKFAFAILGFLVVAIAQRVPMLLSPGPLGYDDGVYGASAIAMRQGDLPYSDVFSSQGPIFLELVHAFDVLGLHALWAPRLLGVAAIIVLILATFGLARRVTTLAGAVAATALVGFSSVLFGVSTSIAAEGAAVAFSICAVWVASGLARHEAQNLRVLAIGILAGCALAVKGPLVAAAVLAAMWLVWRRRGWFSVIAMAVVAALVPLAVSALWGLEAVWSQFIELHLRAEGSIDPIRNLKLLAYRFTTEEAPLILAFLASMWFMYRHLKRRNKGVLAGGRAFLGTPEGEVIASLGVWLVFGSVALLAHSPLFPQHSSYLIVPLAVLAGVGLARVKRPWLVVTSLVLIVGTWELVGTNAFRPFHQDEVQAVAIHDLASVRPLAAKEISDAPGLTWWAGRRSPGSLVDTSLVRIAAGSLTIDDVLYEAHQPGVCAILVWSGRFALLGDLDIALADYERKREYGLGRFLLVRNSCSLELGP